LIDFPIDGPLSASRGKPMIFSSEKRFFTSNLLLVAIPALMMLIVLVLRPSQRVEAGFREKVLADGRQVHEVP
jgi:sensor domain CHASE-containing protein